MLDTEHSDAVKILNIHASKGLEFKAVIVPDMSKDLLRNVSNDKPLFDFDESCGITGIAVDEEGRKNIDGNPLYRNIYEKRVKRETEDSGRILYVAATRAEEFLAFAGKEQEYIDSKGDLRLNTFMRKIKYAIDKAGGAPAHLKILNGSDFAMRDDTGTAPSAADIDRRIEEFRKCGQQEEAPAKMVNPYNAEAFGTFSASQYLKYLDCPRMYFFEYKARLRVDAEDGAEGVHGLRLEAPERGSIVHKILENVILKGIAQAMPIPWRRISYGKTSPAWTKPNSIR